MNEIPNSSFQSTTLMQTLSFLTRLQLSDQKGLKHKVSGHDLRLHWFFKRRMRGHMLCQQGNITLLLVSCCSGRCRQREWWIMSVVVGQPWQLPVEGMHWLRIKIWSKPHKSQKCWKAEATWLWEHWLHCKPVMDSTILMIFHMGQADDSCK